MRGILANKNHMKKDQSGSIISFFPLKYYVNFYVKTTITKKIEELWEGGEAGRPVGRSCCLNKYSIASGINVNDTPSEEC